MKKHYHSLLIACISIISITAYAQPQPPRFYKPVMGGSSGGNEIVKSITGDNAGNVYVVGSFTSQNFTIGSFTLNNSSGSGTSDVFVAKYSPEGLVLWAKSAGGSQADSAVSIAKDISGNIYVTGTFSSSNITFGTTTLSNTSSNTNDIFIVKYDVNGNVKWAKKAGGASDDNVTDIAIDINNNVFITGNFTSASLTFGTSTLTNAGANDIFYTKYDTSGAVQWAHSASSSFDEYAKAITADASGNCFITGSFVGPSLTFGTITLTDNGNENLYITKVNSAGTVVWAHQMGSTASDKGTDVMTDVSGNVFLTGSFSSATMSDDASSFTLTNNIPGKFDIFTVKYTSAGTVAWAKSVGGNGDELASTINIDACGYIYVCGSFNSSGTITFGGTVLYDTTSTSNALMLLKYDGSGNTLWGKQVISTGGNQGTAVSTSFNNNVIVAGYTSSANVYLDGNHIANSDASGTTNDYFLTKVQTTATDVYVFVTNSASAPINFGKVYLFARQTNYQYLHPQDSVTLSGTNIAHFSKVLNLNYFVKVIADTTNYHTQYVTTYNGNKTLWDSIVTWPHNCNANDSIYITMASNSNNSSTGHGKISGKVTKGSGYAGISGMGVHPKTIGDPVPGIDIKIGHNPGGGQMVTNTTTDINGQYTFNNINVGDYKVYVDIPGLGRDSTYNISVTSIDTIFTQKNYIADSNKVYIDIVTGVPLNNTDGFISIAPNPFHEETTITLPPSNNHQPTTIRIMDIVGNEIKSVIVTESKSYILERGNMNAGIYFVQIITSEREIINKKIVIQ